MLFGRVSGRLHQKLNEVTSIYGVGSSKPLSQADGIGLVPPESLSRGPFAIIIINHLVARRCLVVVGSRAGSWLCGSPGEKSEACSLSALRRPLCPCLSVSVCRSGGLIVTHARIKGGRLTVTPGRSDRAVHGGIVGTQRARQDPMKQEHEDEQEQRSFDSATLELELELDPFRFPLCMYLGSPQSASQAARVSRAYQCRGSSAMSCTVVFLDWPTKVVPGIERTRRAAGRCRRQHVKVACLTPTFEVLAGVSRPENWGQPRLLRVTRETLEGSHLGIGVPGCLAANRTCLPVSQRYAISQSRPAQMGETLINRARPCPPHREPVGITTSSWL